MELTNFMDYKKKSLKKLKCQESYEEIDTRLASGWYVDSVGNRKIKRYKTKEVSYKISKKYNWFKIDPHQEYKNLNKELYR